MWPANAFRFSPSIVAVLDASDGSIVDVNPTFERVLGIARSEAVGRRSVDLGVWMDVETRGSIWMRLRSAQRVCGDVVAMRSRDGRIVHGRLYAELFEERERKCVFAIIQDIADGDAPASKPRSTVIDRCSMRPPRAFTAACRRAVSSTSIWPWPGCSATRRRRNC